MNFEKNSATRKGASGSLLGVEEVRRPDDAEERHETRPRAVLGVLEVDPGVLAGPGDRPRMDRALHAPGVLVLNQRRAGCPAAGYCASAMRLRSAYSRISARTRSVRSAALWCSPWATIFVTCLPTSSTNALSCSGLAPLRIGRRSTV